MRSGLLEAFRRESSVAMFQSLLRTESAHRRHCDASFAVECERYLHHCADHGATLGKIRMMTTELLWAPACSRRTPRKESAATSCWRWGGRVRLFIEGA